MLCVIVGDEHWRMRYDLKDFTAILRNFILDDWEALEILKQRSDMSKSPPGLPGSARGVA